jgi:hypothetical protein
MLPLLEVAGLSSGPSIEVLGQSCGRRGQRREHGRPGMIERSLALGTSDPMTARKPATTCEGPDLSSSTYTRFTLHASRDACAVGSRAEQRARQQC